MGGTDELLDLFGPLEVFANLPGDLVNVVMIAENKGSVAGGSVNQPRMTSVVADYDFEDAPELDLILIPGGIGTIPQLDNQTMLDFLRSRGLLETPQFGGRPAGRQLCHGRNRECPRGSQSIRKRELLQDARHDDADHQREQRTGDAKA